MADEIPAAALPFLTKVFQIIFKSDLLKNLLQVTIGTVAVELINLFFASFKKSDAGQITKLLNMDPQAFINIISTMVTRGDMSNDAGERLISLFDDTVKQGPGFALTFPYVYTTEYLKKLTDIVSGKIYQEYAALNRPVPPDPSSVIGGFRFGGSLANGIADILKRNGISDSDIAIMLASTQLPLPADLILSAHHKGNIDRPTAESLLYQLGLSTDNTALYLDGQQDVPDISTLISIALANGFDDQAATVLETDSDMPAIWPFLVQSLGLNKEFASYAWRARYTMPSIEFFYAAVQRNFLSTSDMHLYYKMIGIPPALYSMMDSLIETPLSIDYGTQAFQQHIIGEQKFRDIIKANGASQDTIDIIVQLANAQSNPTSSSATIQHIIYAYEDGFIGPDKLHTMLLDLGLTEAQAQLQQQLADYQVHYTLNKALIAAIEDQFKNKVITGNDALQKLINIGVNNEQAQADLTLWTAQAKVGQKLLTYTQVIDLYKVHLINESIAVEYFVRLGYTSTDAAYLGALLLKEYGGS